MRSPLIPPTRRCTTIRRSISSWQAPSWLSRIRGRLKLHPIGDSAHPGTAFEAAAVRGGGAAIRRAIAADQRQQPHTSTWATCGCGPEESERARDTGVRDPPAIGCAQQPGHTGHRGHVGASNAAQIQLRPSFRRAFQLAEAARLRPVPDAIRHSTSIDTAADAASADSVLVDVERTCCAARPIRRSRSQPGPSTSNRQTRPPSMRSLPRMRAQRFDEAIRGIGALTMASARWRQAIAMTFRSASIRRGVYRKHPIIGFRRFANRYVSSAAAAICLPRSPARRPRRTPAQTRV